MSVLLQIHTFHPEVDTHFVGLINSVFDKAVPYIFSDSIFLGFYPCETSLNQWLLESSSISVSCKWDPKAET